MLEIKSTRSGSDSHCDALGRVARPSRALGVVRRAESARGRASGRVQKQRNNSSGRRRDVSLRTFSEPNRWQRMDWLRVHSVRRGQRMCGLSAVVDEVTVQRSAKTGAVNFGGLLTCGSRTCPSCGPRIAAQTRTDIEQAIRAWRSYGPQRILLFGTFTIRHGRGQSFTEVASAVSKAWAAATGGRGWVRDRDRHGIAHVLRVFEQKWSRANGWHVHVHALLFVDEAMSEEPDHQALLRSMFKRWASKSVALGMGVPLIRAQDMHEVQDAEALDRVSRYFAKETTDAGGEHPGYIAAEMSNGAGKQGLTSLTPGQILAWAMEGEEYVSQLWGEARGNGRGRGVQGQEYARHLYAEFERGMKGRRSIAWSQGMREALGLGAEMTDEEAAQQAAAADAAAADTLVAMSGQDWKRFNARPGRRAELFAFAQHASADELVAWLAEFGVSATPHKRDRAGGTAAVSFEFVGDLPF